MYVHLIDPGDCAEMKLLTPIVVVFGCYTLLSVAGMCSFISQQQHDVYIMSLGSILGIFLFMVVFCLTILCVRW